MTLRGAPVSLTKYQRTKGTPWFLQN
jgi:hypothetical protein